MALGSNVRRLRDQLGWTLEELSTRSGVEVGTISALEVRDSKRSNYALPLAEAMGVSLSVLLDEPTAITHAREVDHDLSYPTLRMPPEVDREAIVSGKAAHQQVFMLRVEDDSCGDRYPAGSRIIWSRTRRPKFGSVVLVLDRHQALHVRVMQQGRAPGAWLAASINPAYATLDSVADGLQIVATFDGFQLPPDEGE